MRVMACVGLIALSLGLTGCGLFGRKPQAAPAPPGRLPPGPAPSPLPDPGSGGLGSGSGILVGQVLGSYDRRAPARTYVQYQVVSTKDGKENLGAAVDAKCDGQGYFTIMGLDPGKSYLLIARAGEGDKVVMAGTLYASPPNPKLLIRMSEDYVSSTTPPLPPPPAFPGGKDKAKSPGDQKTENSAGNSMRRAAELGSPRPGGNGPPPVVPAGPRPNPAATRVRPENVANIGSGTARAPTNSIPGPGDRPPRPRDFSPSPTQPETPIWLPATPPSEATQPNPPTVPYCKLTANRVENFALSELDGRTWEFRNHRGRLVLLDFWGTWCKYCRPGIPHLRILQQEYGPYGLQVVGIANEMKEPVAEQVKKVRSFASRYEINYTMLLGTDYESSCPVREQLGVERYPTLILLDESGQILWRSEGLEEPQLRQLEKLIKDRLGVR